MAIKYFPNRIYKKNDAAIDRVIAKRHVYTVSGYQDITADGLDTTINPDPGSDWQIDFIKLNFSNATPRNYTVKIANGRKVVSNLNDFLWFQTQNPSTIWQKITLSEGFYTGSELATELQTKLNANTAFSAIGTTFTVTYTAATGLFTVTPSAGTIKYIYHKVDFPLPDQYSIGGHLFGFDADAGFAAAISSSTPVFGLDDEAWIIDQTGSIVTEHYNDDLHILSIDQSVRIETNTAGTAISYAVGYEAIV